MSDHGDLFEEGRRLYDAGNYEAASDLLARALQEQPSSVETAYALGVAMLKAGKSSDAEETFRTLLQSNASLHRAWLMLGNSLLAQDRFEEARESYERALTLRPDLHEAQVQLARLVGEADQSVAVELPTRGQATGVDQRSSFKLGQLYMLAFDLVGPDGVMVHVEMPGTAMAGRVNPGDEVQLLEYANEDGLISATKVWNYTLNTVVESYTGLRGDLATEQAAWGRGLGKLVFSGRWVLRILAVLFALFVAGFIAWGFKDTFTKGGLAEDATVQLLPTSGSAGDEVTVIAEGFDGNETVRVFFGAETVQITQARDGVLRTTFAVPADVAPFAGETFTVKVFAEGSGVDGQAIFELR